MANYGLLDPFACGTIPLDDWLSLGMGWMVDEWRPFFQAIKFPIDQILQWFAAFLGSTPPTVVLVVLGLIAWQVGRSPRHDRPRRAALRRLHRRLARHDGHASIVLTALVLAVVIGLPLAIWAARSDRAWSIMRPLLDGMQTIPAFVYLMLVVMLFGIGNVPGVIVTVIFAIVPLIRLTPGTRQVPEEVVEATRAFGATDRQLLWKAQVPLALPTIMAGVNQTLMMSLSMVVIASMISVGGLGQMVLRGIGRLDVGLAAVGGLGIVMLAVVLDRLTQALCTPKRRPGAIWSQGPVGLLRGWLAGRGSVTPAT